MGCPSGPRQPVDHCFGSGLPVWHRIAERPLLAQLTPSARSAFSRFLPVQRADLEAACLGGAPSSRVWLRPCECIGCGHVFGLLARETNVPLALMLVRMALRPISETRSLWRLPFTGLPSRSVGIDTETLACFGPPAMMANDNGLIRSPPIPARHYPTCGVVVSSLHPELPRRRGFARRAWAGRLL